MAKKTITDERAAVATRALRGYAGDAGSKVIELLEDLRFYCDRHRLDFGADRQAYGQYCYEKTIERRDA